MKRIFVTGIGTDVGKTVVSSILCKALGADYWKPFQCGDTANTDTMRVQKLVGNHPGSFHPEAFNFRNGLSPHAAAELEGYHIDLDELAVPPTRNTMIIEGAGGILVPLNHRHTLVDFIKEIDAEVVVVSKHYLGSINHTLLTLFALHSYDVPIKGIIYNGAENPSTEQAIHEISQVETLGRIPWADQVTPAFVEEQAERLGDEIRAVI